MDEAGIKETNTGNSEQIIQLWPKIPPAYMLWNEFDRNLAKDFSRFITGNLYSRTVLTLPERQMVAWAMLPALRAGGELKLHVNAALNVGCNFRKLTEFFPS